MMALQNALTSLLTTSLSYSNEKGFSNSQTPSRLLGRYHNIIHILKNQYDNVLRKKDFINA